MEGDCDRSGQQDQEAVRQQVQGVEGADLEAEGGQGVTGVCSSVIVVCLLQNDVCRVTQAVDMSLKGLVRHSGTKQQVKCCKEMGTVERR